MSSKENGLKSYQKIKYDVAKKLFSQLGKTDEDLQNAISEGLVTMPRGQRTILTQEQRHLTDTVNEIIESETNGTFRMTNHKGENVKPVLRFAKVKS